VRSKISMSVELRFEARDYMSPSPSKVITPAPGASLSGWINDVVATASLAFTF
jgi:hypothetical protein